MRILRKRICSVWELYPRIGSRVIDLRHGCNAGRTSIVAGYYKHPTVRQHCRGGIPATIRHRSHLRPAIVGRIEDIRIANSDEVGHVPTRHENATVGKYTMATPEDVVRS